METLLSKPHENKKIIRHQKIIFGLQRKFIEFQIRLKILMVIINNVRNPFVVFRISRSLDQLRRMVLGDHRIEKLIKANGKYYWDLYIPGFPSIAFNEFIEGEINRIYPLQKHSNRLTNLFLAITKKCPLRCEHCFEWNALNGREKLSSNDLKKIVSKFQQRGIGQIQFSGGEPLMRVDDIKEILNSVKMNTEFWVFTSGFNLTRSNAETLKKAGLTGMVISLDHYDSEKHNKFRGFDEAFEWVLKGVRNSLDTDLVCALSICATKDFISMENLMKYADHAKELGVSFIQLFEPKAVGNYAGKDVILNKELTDILTDFFLMMNYDKKYRDYPIVIYPGYHLRNIGCFSSGNRNLYVDTDGDVHSCPFCHTKMGSVLNDELNPLLDKMISNGCKSFSNVTI